ncbi:MAG: TetR/AcrR family transcriptional regulator [Armatimonadetes bacterium]|nr:TetR/AcrR family transcriptional regulator [Armatimonadota bacterium]MDW8154398.1 TetR/AcrR family transcriptional regulator [Armatimonadota bacterium]
MARLTEEARRRLTQRRRQQILEAAVAVFSEAGYEGATVRAIAERAGLAEGTLYLYFPSKRHLLLEAWEEVALASLHGVMAHPELLDDEALLAQIFRTQFELLERHSSFLRLVMHRADVDPEFRRSVQERLRELKAVVEGRIAKRMEEGVYARFEVPIVVAAIAALLRGIPLFDPYDPDPLFARYSREEVARELARLVFRGLLSRPGSRESPPPTGTVVGGQP